MPATIGALRVDLGADTAKFEDGLKKASSSLQAFGKSAGAVAAGTLLAKAIEKGIEALGDLTAATFRSIDAMAKASREAEKLGVSVEQFSKLSVAATIADVSVSDLSKAIIGFGAKMQDNADKPTAAVNRGLQALGVSARDVNGRFKDGTKLTEEIADRFTKFRDGIEKTTIAAQIFGPELGPKLLPLLNQGSEGFRKASEQARQLNLVMSTESSASAARFTENMKLVSLGLTTGIFNAIAEKVLPALESLSTFMLKATISFLSFIGATKQAAEVQKILTDARAKLNPISEEAAQREKQFKERIEQTTLQTMELAGAFRGQLAPGLAAMAVQMKLVKVEAFQFGVNMDELPPKVRLLNEALLQLKGAQITQENLMPWDKYKQTLIELDLLFQKNHISVETFRLAAAKAADDMQSKYIQATAGIAGAFSEMFTTIGGEHKGWAQAAKIAAAAQALINTFQGASLALAQGGIFGFASAAAITAKGLALVAAIKGTPLGFAKGGSFKVPGAGGMDSQFLPMMASPGERVTVETPAQQRDRGGGQTIVLRGSSFHISEVRDLFDYINAGLGDGHRLKVVTG